MIFADVLDRMQEAISVVFSWLPSLLAALILLVGYIVAKILGKLVTRLLGRVGLDGWLHSSQVGKWISKVSTSPSGGR